MGRLKLKSRHRLLCGDSTKEEDVERVMAGEVMELTLTDPPYGIAGTESGKNNYISHDDTKENLVRIIDGFLHLALAASKRVVLTPGNSNQPLYPDPAWTMAWFTPAGAGRGPWGFCCWQPILCYGKDYKLANGLGGYPDALVHTEQSEKSLHPCPKPIRFWCWLMERNCGAGDAVFDPFLGSGTTLIAAEQLDRRCLGIELEPRYCDIIVQRWEALTGKKARMDGSGKTFAEIQEAQA